MTATPILKCLECGKTRKPPPAFNYVSRAEWERDPFCTSVCARLHHGTTAPTLHGENGIDYGATKRKRAARV